MAIAETEGPQAALNLVETTDLGGYYLFHAIRANLLRRLRRDAEATAAYETARSLATNKVERRFLEHQR